MLGLFKDKTARVDDGENISPIPQRSMSRSSNEDFGTHIVVNEGIATPDMEAWYLNIDEDTGEASEIPQREIMMNMAKKNKQARKAFFRQDKEDRKKALQQEDLPEWAIPAANSLSADTAGDFQLHFQHLQDNLFHCTRVDSGEDTDLKQVWVVQARRNGDLVLVNKMEDMDRFTDTDWEVRSKGEADLKPPEMDFDPENEDLDKEMVAADITDFTREELKEDDLDSEVLQEYLKGLYREYDLDDSVKYKVEYSDGFFRINVNNGEAILYSFIDHGKIQDFFGIPEWSIHILWDEQTRDRIPYPDDNGDDE